MRSRGARSCINACPIHACLCICVCYTYLIRATIKRNARLRLLEFPKRPNHRIYASERTAIHLASRPAVTCSSQTYIHYATEWPCMVHTYARCVCLCVCVSYYVSVSCTHKKNIAIQQWRVHLPEATALVTQPNINCALNYQNVHCICYGNGWNARTQSGRTP